MEAMVRRKLEMAECALDFADAHPSDDASCTTLVNRLRDRIDHAERLMIQEHNGRELKHGALERRTERRRTIQQVQLRHLAAVARLAAREHPELVEIFRLPDSNAPHMDFITAAKVLLDAAAARAQDFMSLGLGDTFLQDLAAAVAEFDRATALVNTGARSHVGARGELFNAADECMGMVEVLDGLYRLRFSHDPEAVAAWESARTIGGPKRVRRQRQTGEKRAGGV